MMHRKLSHIAYIGNWLFRIQTASCSVQMASTVSSASHYCLYTSVFSEKKCGFFYFPPQTPKNSDTGKMIILFSTQNTIIYTLSYSSGWKCFHLGEWCKLMRMGALKNKIGKEKSFCIKSVIEKIANCQK